METLRPVGPRCLKTMSLGSYFDSTAIVEIVVVTFGSAFRGMLFRLENNNNKMHRQFNDVRNFTSENIDDV